jgi:hypothetical protein
MYHMQITTAFLADAAIVANGKLYVQGGGWDTIFCPTFPSTHPSMAIALIFRVEYSEAPANIPLLIELLDEDERARPEFRAEGIMGVGHPPGLKHGSPILVPQAITINMLALPRPEFLHFKVSADSNEVATIPFRVAEALTVNRVT